MFSFIIAVFVLVFLVLLKSKEYRVCAYLLWYFALVIAFLSGAWFVGKTYAPLAPYFRYGLEKTKSEQIEVVSFHHQKIEFSNGESVHSAKLIMLSIVEGVCFIFIMGLVWGLGRYITLILTQKYAPQIHRYYISIFHSGADRERFIKS